MSDRSIEHEVEVSGTPEEVWQAIATGHGITSWFVPAQVEERVGGAISLDFGTGFGTQPGEVTAWEPPRRVVFQMPGSSGARLAYEWQVEVRDGGKCLVRLVTSGFLSDADWQAEYDSTYEGWKLFLSNLQLVRSHFPAQRCASVLVNGTSSLAPADAWRAIAAALALPTTPHVGDHVDAHAQSGLTLAGTVERFEKHLLTVLLDAPTRGIGIVGVEGAGPVFVTVYLYLFGDDAQAIVARDAAAWRAWMEAQFAPDPAPA